MKNKIVTVAIICGALFSCKNAEKSSSANEINSDALPIPPKEITECYQYIRSKDTVQATLVIAGVVVSGDLDYKLFGKDKNSGKINGSMRGDTLIANYTFNSEGMESVREVAFLKINKTLIEGYGASELKNGKMVFKEIKKLNFASGVVLNQIPCK